MVPISGVPLEYLLDFYKAGRGLATVSACLSGPAYRLSDEHHVGIVVLVLVLNGIESGPVSAREGAPLRGPARRWPLCAVNSLNLKQYVRRVESGWKSLPP